LKNFRDLAEETWRYDSVKTAFKELFNSVDFRILEKKLNTIANQEQEQREKYYIQVEEDFHRKYSLEESASGYYHTSPFF
jgi:hypothetical protein